MLSHARPALAKVVDPAGRALARLGVSPDAITIVGTAGVMTGALVFYPRGIFFWGTVFITAFVFSDMLDGAVARVTGRTGVWGAFLDSTLDRFGDAAVFGGLLLWYFGRGNDFLLGCLALYCLVSGVITSYIKARAEGLGMTCNVGIAERSERLVTILVLTGLSQFPGVHVLGFLRPLGLWILTVATTVTVIQRVVEVRRQAVVRTEVAGG